MNRIDLKFQEDKKLLSIYFSAGFPNLEDTVPILKKLEAAGVDTVEIGLPFSDPLADGPTIQESSTQALRNGMTTEKLFTQLEGIREHITIPLVLMGYFNPMMQYGIEKFCQRCEAIGIDGLIIPDLRRCLQRAVQNTLRSTRIVQYVPHYSANSRRAHSLYRQSVQRLHLYGI